jgi:hypothetical protein
MNPSLVLRGGPSGPTFDPSTPGNVLTIDTDGKSVKPTAVSGLNLEASDILNDTGQPGATVADVLNGTFENNGNSGATKNVRWLNGNAHALTLTANCTVTIPDFPAGTPAWMELEVTQGGSGSYTLTIAGAKTPGGAGLVLSTAVGSLDIVDVYWNGSVIRAAVAGLAFA